MKYSCAGLVVVSTRSSTRPGWVRHASGVDVAGTGEGVTVRVAVEVGGIGVRVEVGWFDGVQAATSARSVKSIVIRFVRRSRSRIASRIA
jgi:hypothetical protein